MHGRGWRGRLYEVLAVDEDPLSRLRESSRPKSIRSIINVERGNSETLRGMIINVERTHALLIPRLQEVRSYIIILSTESVRSRHIH